MKSSNSAGEDLLGRWIAGHRENEGSAHEQVSAGPFLELDESGDEGQTHRDYVGEDETG